MNCRFCNTSLRHILIDMANTPPSNAFLIKEQLNEPEITYPLKLWVCHECFLAQIDEYKKSGEIFNSDYAYFSSYSKSWVEHARQFVEMIVPRLELDSTSMVMEIASNDGYLLQHFKKKNIPCFGIEPAPNTAAVAISKGIDCISDFFGTKLGSDLACRGKKADLVIGNNVLAHVPDLHDFVKGIKIVLADDGVVAMEFPHVLRLIQNNQFDTIYHEHFSYFSLHTVTKIFRAYGLTLFDVEELQTHGGSLRIYARHTENDTRPVMPSMHQLAEKEEADGVTHIEFYTGFQQKADQIKNAILSFLIDQKQNGRTVAAYGAAAKGNTLINYCGIKKDLIPFVVDASPHKQNKFLPGSHIPVAEEFHLKKMKPDYVLILPWNIKAEIMDQLAYIREWNGKFVVPIPALKIYDAH